jgi:hypothetical protein
MNQSEPFQSDQLREGIKQVLVLQYQLHEVGHHSSEALAGYANKPVAPLAHAVSDIYKCLHQGTFGVGHSIDNPQNFERNLIRDLMGPQTAFDEPLLEKVSADGLLLRVNLRPFRALFAGSEEKGSELLLQVCLKSAAMETGSQPMFFHIIDLFRDLNKSGDLMAGGTIFSFPEQTVDGFLREIRKFVSSSGFIPVLGHSPVYKSFNGPSYRVVHLNALMRSPLAELIQTPKNIEAGYVH